MSANINEYSFIPGQSIALFFLATNETFAKKQELSRQPISFSFSAPLVGQVECKLCCYSSNSNVFQLLRSATATIRSDRRDTSKKFSIFQKFYLSSVYFSQASPPIIKPAKAQLRNQKKHSKKKKGGSKEPLKEVVSKEPTQEP